MCLSASVWKVLFVLLFEKDLPGGNRYVTNCSSVRTDSDIFSSGLFEIGSLICGAAPNSSTLIFGRAIAGLGCSGIFSGSLIILVHSVPLRLVPIFTGLVAANFGIAAVVGPLMGGVSQRHTSHTISTADDISKAVHRQPSDLAMVS